MAIAALRIDLADALAREGIQASRAKYSGHVTIGFVRGAHGLLVAIPPVRFSAQRLVLMATYPGRHIHRVVHSWPLDA